MVFCDRRKKGTAKLKPLRCVRVDFADVVIPAIVGSKFVWWFPIPIVKFRAQNEPFRVICARKNERADADDLVEPAYS